MEFGTWRKMKRLYRQGSGNTWRTRGIQGENSIFCENIGNILKELQIFMLEILMVADKKLGMYASLAFGIQKCLEWKCHVIRHG